MTYKSIDINSVAPEHNRDTRLYALSHGDVFTLNDIAIKQAFNMTTKKIKLGKKINDHFICTEKIKRRRWWQFWKPKYWGAKFVYVESSSNEHEEEHLVNCFCGGEAELDGGTYGYPTYKVRCLKCGGTWSMDTYSLKEAIERWNSEHNKILRKN